MSREINGIKAHNKTKDITGKKFGRLTVVEYAGMRIGKATWKCRCECGREKTVHAASLNRGLTTSCGCYHKEMVGDQFRKHGLHGIPEYWVWVDMRDRCNRPGKVNYHNYGGRGIRVCKRWDSFQKFYDDMGPRPSNKHSIERIDNDGDYKPSNCRWATKPEQARNRRQNVWVEIDGERMILKDAATKHGVNYFVLHGRYCRLKWPIERAISEPVHKRNKRSR